MQPSLYLAKQLKLSQLMKVFDKIEIHKDSLLAETEKSLSQLPKTMISEQNLHYLPSMFQLLFNELHAFHVLLKKGKNAPAFKHLLHSMDQLVKTSYSFGMFVIIWTTFREILSKKCKVWFPAKQAPAILENIDRFWTLNFIEMMNIYLHYSDEIIREKNVESSVLFHTTQSITTELNLEALLNKIVFHASMLLKNKQIYLFVVDGNPADLPQNKRLVLRASNQVNEAYGEYSLQLGEGPVGQVAEQLLPLVLNEYYQVQKKLPFLGNAAHILAVPIVFSDQILGVLLAAECKKNQLITNQEKELLLMYSQQIAITFKNVLLYQEQTKVTLELEEKNRMLETQAEVILKKSAQMVVLNEVSQKVNSSLDLKEVIALLTRQAAESIGLDRCVVWLFDDMKVNLHAAAACGLPTSALEKMELQLSEIRNTVFFRVLSEMIHGQITRSEASDLFDNKLQTLGNVNRMLVVPLILKEEAIGFLAVDDTREAHEFLEDEITLISAIANQTVMAIENAQLYQKVREQAITDGLTGVYNHRFFQIRFADEFAHSKRYGNDLSLIILDIDHFKQYNDTYGHVAGDLALKEIANLTRASVRENDIVARYGGEEFAIILPMTNAEGAKIVAERIRKSVLECRFLGDLNVPQVSITVSMGISSYTRETESREILFQQTDGALYYAKNHGRNQAISHPHPDFEKH